MFIANIYLLNRMHIVFIQVIYAEYKKIKKSIIYEFVQIKRN